MAAFFVLLSFFPSVDPLPRTLREYLIKFEEKISTVLRNTREVCDWMTGPVDVVVLLQHPHYSASPPG